VGDLRERDHFKDPRVEVRIILRCRFKKWDMGKKWIELAQDRDSWQAGVNTVMNLQVP